ncbi:unnamed protein product [Musa hybrid cultivar]
MNRIHTHLINSCTKHQIPCSCPRLGLSIANAPYPTLFVSPAWLGLAWLAPYSRRLFSVFVFHLTSIDHFASVDRLKAPIFPLSLLAPTLLLSLAISHQPLGWSIFNLQKGCLRG